MKKVLLIMFALMTTAWASAQVEDQLALKRLVDTSSNLADVKDVKSQMDLFADDDIFDVFSFLYHAAFKQTLPISWVRHNRKHGADASISSCHRHRCQHRQDEDAKNERQARQRGNLDVR